MTSATEPSTERPVALVDPVYAAVEVTGDAWTWLVMAEVVAGGVGRFNGLQRALGISRQTLSSRLDQLVAAEMLTRDPSETGSRVDYRPTDRGRDFFACLAVAARYGTEWCGGEEANMYGGVHRTCGAGFEAELRCDHCRETIDARSVLVERVRRASRTLIASGRHRAPDLDALAGASPSGLAAAMTVIGDRWSSLVVRECFLGTRRFDDFVDRLGVATNILSDRLHRLVDKGVLVRTPYETRPLRHEYRLTQKGLALYPIPLALLAWGERWLTAGDRGMTLIHRSCGRYLRPILCCRACTRAVSVADITFDESERP